MWLTATMNCLNGFQLAGSSDTLNRCLLIMIQPEYVFLVCPGNPRGNDVIDNCIK